MQRVPLNLEQLRKAGSSDKCIMLSTAISPQHLARYAIALANGSGGLIVMGLFHGQWQDASDIHPLQLTHAIFELSGGKLSVNVHHEEVEGHTVLVAHVPQAPYLLATPEGEVVAWDGLELVPLSALGREPLADQDYTATVPPLGSLSDFDTLGVGRLRRSLQGRATELNSLADLDFLQALGLLVEHGDSLKPTLAGIILAGTPQALKRHMPQAEICYYYHRSADVEFQFREDMLKPLPAALERLRELIQARNGFSPLQVGLFRLEIWDFDEVVYREAILNALIHRDYQLRDAVHIHHYPDRLEIYNPGGLSGGITSENILRHQPKRRNPLLAEALARLGYVERAGVGVDKMYQLLLRHGKEPPEYLSYPDALTLTIRNPGFDVDFVRFIARKQEEMQTFSLDMLIVLAQLKREGSCMRPQLATALQLPEDRIGRILHTMEDADLIIRIGRGKDSSYELSESSRLAIGVRRRMVTGANLGAVQQALQRASKLEHPVAVSSNSSRENIVIELAHRVEGVSNAELREILQLNSSQASALLRKLALRNQLEKRGNGRLTRYYGII